MSRSKPFGKEELSSLLPNSGKVVRVGKESVIASLWAGYGSVSSFKATWGDSSVMDLIVKRVNPPGGGSDESVSHQRKIRSYFVEAHFYRMLVPKILDQWGSVDVVDACTINSIKNSLPVVPFPYLIDHTSNKEDVNPYFTFLLSDLRKEYRSSRSMHLTRSETEAALCFLARFHATFWEIDYNIDFDEGVWECGGYWHLDTRMEEYDYISNNEWGSLKKIALAIDKRMKDGVSSKHRVLCHGDFKEANLLFKPLTDGSYECAAVDFQYAGYGYGLKDVVMLVVSSIAPSLLRGSGERNLLEYYFKELCRSLDCLGKHHSGFCIEDIITQYEVSTFK